MHKIAAALTAALWLAAPAARAHCDGLDGPVVKAARLARSTGNVNHALAWVRASDEAEVRKAFREQAEMRFFETVVRLHRAAEGEPFTGLKPAGRDLGPAIPAADRAIETGSAEELLALLKKQVERGITERFEAVRAHAGYGTDVARGREFVKAYVELMHYVERFSGHDVHVVPGREAATEHAH